MRILLVIIQFPPDVNATGLLMGQLCEGLKAHGHEVSVITSFPHYEGFRVRREYRGKLYEWDRSQGMDVLRLALYAPGKKSMVRRLFSYLSFAAGATVAGALLKEKWDVILCANGAFFTGVTSWLIGRAKKIPFIYNVQDLYPEAFIQAGQLQNRPAIAVLKTIERFMYRKAEHVTVISPSMRDGLRQKGVHESKISLIPNFVDADFIRPLPKVNSFSERHGLAGKFVITHAGNLGYVYDLDTLLGAASRLSKEKDILFLIVGDGVAKTALQRKAEALGLENVRFLPFQPHESLPWLRAASDVQVSLYKKGSVRYSMPSKVYEIMASGRPLLASADPGSDVWELVERARCGICVAPEDCDELTEAILKLYGDTLLRETMGGNGRARATEDYSREAVVQSYHDLILRVAWSGSQGQRANSESDTRDRKSDVRANARGGTAVGNQGRIRER
jgi:colanic acid biosynthesis glycosyl transferase WcaI